MLNFNQEIIVSHVPLISVLKSAHARGSKSVNPYLDLLKDLLKTSELHSILHSAKLIRNL